MSRLLQFVLLFYLGRLDLLQLILSLQELGLHVVNSIDLSQDGVLSLLITAGDLGRDLLEGSTVAALPDGGLSKLTVNLQVGSSLLSLPEHHL